MTRRVPTIGRDEPVAGAARRLVETNERCLYVVGGSGRLVGVLAGTIDRRSEVERAEWLTGAVPGVVAVRNRLRYPQDDGTAAA